jgi:hypothetical protein
LLHGERRAIEGIAVADLVWGERLLQQPLHKFAPLPRATGRLNLRTKSSGRCSRSCCVFMTARSFENFEITIPCSIQ